jgi:DNA repair protein RecO (recombination protein O)
LLADATEDYDAHPCLFDEALTTLSELGTPDVPTPVRLLRFEMVLLRELGYRPVLQACALCAAAVDEAPAFSPAAGGVVCPACRARQRDRQPLSVPAWKLLQALGEAGDAWRRPADAAVRAELRRLLGQYFTYLLGRQPRLLPYLGS